MRLSQLIACLTAVMLGGCNPTPSPPSTSAGYGPPFNPLAFFDGHTRSWGVIESRSGAPTERIVTDSHGERDGADRLRMVQRLSFQDGTSHQRDWTMWRSGPDRFDATANDMVGVAKGKTDGNIFHWRWVLARPSGDGLLNVTMNQWMYRLADGSVMIRTTVSKFGVIVAEVTEQFTHARSG